MGTKAGLTPVDQHVDIPTPAERIARLSENVGQRADVLPPRAPIRGEAEPAPPPELSAVSPGEARLGDVVDQSNVETRRRGMRRLLIPPGSAAAATGVERILGENLPGGAGEHFRNIASAHEEEEQAAREQHPLAGATSDVGRLYLELEGLGRLPGAPGRFFREPGIGGAPATRGMFEEGRLTGTLEREGVGTIRDRLARAAGVEGRKFGALEGGRAALERRPPEEIIERGAAGAAGGAVFGAGGQAVTEVASPLIRSTLRGMARRNLPPMESPFMRPGELPSGQPRALLAPPTEPAGAAGMPDHVVNAGAAQRVALELTGQSPEPRPPGQPVAASSQGQSVAPIGTDINDPLRLAGNEARDLSLQRPQTPETRARLKVIQAYIAAHTPPEEPRPAEPAARAAPVAPEREIPAEPPPSTIVETPYEPPKPKPAVIPEGAPEVLGGEAADVGRQAAKPGDVGTLPQPRRKNFKAYDDAALEARWIEVSDRMEAMARQRDEGTTPWVRKEERAAGAGTGRGGGFGGYSREKGVLSGTAINASGGRAIGRMKDDTRILGELEREFHARGINPADVMDRYVERANRLQAEEESGTERRALETQDEGGGDTSFHVAEPKPGRQVREVKDFYSRVRRALAASPVKRATGRQWLAYFEKVPGGTSKEELERTGLKQLLESKLDEPVDRELLQFEEGRNPLKLDEVMYGKGQHPELATAYHNQERAWEHYRDELEEQGLSHTYAQDVVEGADSYKPGQAAFDYLKGQGAAHPVDAVLPERARHTNALRNFAKNLWDARLETIAMERKHGVGYNDFQEEGRAKYSQYTLPGGEHYREVIVIAPEGQGLRPGRADEQIRETARSMAERNGENWDQLGPNGRQRFFDLAKKTVGESYESGHWSGLINPIGHLRITDRTVMGEPTLFIEEIQSDVHQLGREAGYRISQAELLALKENLALKHQQELHTKLELARELGGQMRAVGPYETEERVSWNPNRMTKVTKAEVRIGTTLIGDFTLWPRGESAKELPDRLRHEAPYNERGWVFNGVGGNMMNVGTHTSNLDDALTTVAGRLVSVDAVPGLVRGLVRLLIERDPANQRYGEMEYELAKVNQAFTAADLAYDKARRGVPKLPMSRTEDWAGLMVRRALDEAIRTGKTRLAWTTGKQQAERYDMAQFVDHLVYRPENQMLVGYKGGDTVATHTVAPDALSEWVGADVAKRLLAAPLDDLGYHELHGDFGVGGAGQSVFYDQILPKIIQAQLKKFGGGKVDIDKPLMEVPSDEDRDVEEGYTSEQPVWSVEIPKSAVEQIAKHGLYVAEGMKPSPWLDGRAAVTETDAAFGGEHQMELSLNKAVEQLQLSPEKPAAPLPPARKGEPKVTAVAHYVKRAAAARKIVADLKKGQATWPGRQFPDVWPGIIGKPGGLAKYGEFVDSIGTMLQALRSPFVETLVMFATREGKIVTSHVVTSGLVGQASIDGPGGVDLSQLFLEDAQRAGATHVHTAHNHPSGKTDPSGLGGDIGMWGSLTSRADKLGMKPGVNLIIDDDQFSVSQFRKESDGWAVQPKYVPYRYSPKVPWFTPAVQLAERIESPDTVAAVVHRLGKRHNGYLIHLSNASAIVGVEAFTPGDSIEEAVATAGSRYGASFTIVGVNDQVGFDRFLDVYRKSPTLIRSVMDVVAALGEGKVKSARRDGGLKIDESERLEQQWLSTITGRRIHEPGPMADPWRGQPGYLSDPAVQGARPIIVPFGFPVDGSLAVREGLGPGYGEDNLPNTASVIAQEAIDAAAKLGLAPAAETTIGKLLTSLAGTRLEQIGGPLHLVLVEYERQRAQLEELVQSDILKESLNKSAVEFLARLPYFNEFRAVSLLAYLRDKLPKAIGKRLGVTPDRQEALFNAAEAIAEFGPDGKPVFRDVLERTGELDQVGYDRLLKVYGHPAKLEAEVAQLKQSIDGIRRQMGKASVALSPSAYAVERFKLGLRAKQEAKKGAAEQVLASLKAERNAKKAELVELKGQRDLHAKEGILDDDAAAALPAELARVATELDHLRAEISRFEGLVRGRTPAGPAVDPKELPAKLKELDQKLVKWRELRGLAKEHEEVLRGRWSNLRAFRSAYEAQAAGEQAGAVRITEQEARVRWASLSKSEQAVVRRFAQSAARAKEQGLAGHVNRELAKLDYEISSDIEAYVHHYGFEDEGAMVLWFGSALRRKKLIAGARQHRGGVEGFKRHLEGARLHGGLPLALQKLQNEFAEALERVMFTTPDPNLVRPLGEGEEPPDGFSLVLGRFGEFKGQPFAVANTIYKELEFFQKKPPSAPTTDERANRAWELTKRGVSRLVYYWALNQLLSVGTATRNFIGGAIQYATLVAENIAGGDFVAATHNLLALAKAMSPGAVRRVPMTEFGASQQTLRELDQAHGLFRAFMNTALIPFGVVENFFKRALTIGARELEAQRIAKEMLADGTIDKGDVDRVVTQLFDAPTFEMRASEEMTRDAFAYNYNNIPLALKRMNKSAIGKALIPFPIYGYKFARHAGRYVGAVSRLARMKGRAGDLQKVIAAIIIFGIPVVLTWLGDEEGKAKTTDPGSGIKYDFDRSGRIYIGKNDEGNELWVRTNSYSFYGLGAVVGHTLHDRTLIEAKNYVSEFYSVGPGFQAADYLRQVRNRYQTYRNNASIAGDFARSWIPFHRPLETVTRMVDPTRRKQESFTESMLYAIPIPEPVLNQYGLSRGEPRTAMGGAQLVPGYNPLLEFLKEFGGVNIKPINPKQAQDEYRRAAVRAQVRERRSTANSARLRRLELRQRERQP